MVGATRRAFKRTQRQKTAQSLIEWTEEVADKLAEDILWVIQRLGETLDSVTFHVTIGMLKAKFI